MGPYEFGIGDYDRNQTVDLDDYAFFTQCFTGPNGGPREPGCEPFDFNANGAIDLSDTAGFQRAFMEFQTAPWRSRLGWEGHSLTVAVRISP